MKVFLKRIYYIGYTIMLISLIPFWVALFFLLMMITGEFKDYREQRRKHGWII